MQQVIAVKNAGRGQRVDEPKRRWNPFRHGHGDRAVERNDRRWLNALEKTVEPENLRPVCIFGPRGPAVQGGDRRLQGEQPALFLESPLPQAEEAWAICCLFQRLRS